MTEYQCYLDDSYADTSNVVTLAGYIAPRDVWIKFEEKVEDSFSDFAVDILHTKEFRSGRASFKGWTRDKKIEFIRSIFSILENDEVCGISVSITKGLHKAFKKSSPKTAGSSALGMAAGIAFSQCCNGTGLPILPKERKVHFFVEAGNKNNAQIRTDFKKLRSKGRLENANSLAFISKDSCRAIQLADFWALYSRRLAEKVLRSASDENPADFTEKELQEAFSFVPHALDTVHGNVTQSISNRRLLNVGNTSRVWFGPKQA